MAIPSDSAPFIGSKATSSATVAKVGTAASGPPPSGDGPAPPEPWSPAGVDDEQPEENASNKPPTAISAVQQEMAVVDFRFASRPGETRGRSFNTGVAPAADSRTRALYVAAIDRLPAKLMYSQVYVRGAVRVDDQNSQQSVVDFTADHCVARSRTMARPMLRLMMRMLPVVAALAAMAPAAGLAGGTKGFRNTTPKGFEGGEAPGSPILPAGEGAGGRTATRGPPGAPVGWGAAPR